MAPFLHRGEGSTEGFRSLRRALSANNLVLFPGLFHLNGLPL